MNQKTVAHLSDDEIEELEQLLLQLYGNVDAMNPDGSLPLSLDGVDGMFAALSLSPKRLPISAWMALVLGEGEFDDKETTQRCRNLLIRHQQSIQHLFRQTDLTDYAPCMSFSEEDDQQYDVNQWCSGFALGVEQHEEDWAEKLGDDVGLAQLNVIVAMQYVDVDGQTMITEDLSNDEVQLRNHQQVLIDLMRQEVSECLGEEADNLMTIMFALKGLQDVMLQSKPAPKQSVKPQGGANKRWK